jgi:flavin-binding protein dodecin
MTEHVYKVIEIVGTSETSWEDAAKRAVEQASRSLKDLRVGEVTGQDLKIEDGRVVAYRTKLSISFRFHEELSHHG